MYTRCPYKVRIVLEGGLGYGLGGGNIQPAGHIRPAMAIFLALSLHLWLKCSPQDT